jgi:hypothetical protein
MFGMAMDRIVANTTIGLGQFWISMYVGRQGEGNNFRF